jgi:hypothetical protein
MGDGGKGSAPRPFSVSKEEFDNRWDTIFKKDKEVQVRVNENKDGFGTCGCGRSPTGKCVGWHGLSEEEYLDRKEKYETGKVELSGKEIKQ